MTTFHLLRPWWLLALPFAVLAVWILWRRLANSQSWRAVCDEHLLPHLLVGPHGTRGLLPITLLSAGLAVAIAALCGPAWDTLEQPVYRAKTARVVILDLSASMDAGDAKPSRLARARFKVADALQHSADGQTGLVVFAGDAFVVSPLTDDAKTLLAMLPALTTEVVPSQGSRADLALEAALLLLQQGGAHQGSVLLVTDGINDKRATIAARKLRLSGFPVSVLAVGTEQGAPVPLPQGGFLKDRQGNIVVPKTDHAQLAQVAAEGGGRFASLTADSQDIQTLLRPDLATEFNLETELADRSAVDWRDEGPWLLLLLLPIAAMAFRRGWLLGIAILTFGANPESLQAFEWRDLWARSDQQAARAIREGNPTAALGAQDPHWQGSALYRTEAFDQAAKAFARLTGPTGNYNRANALARDGKLEQAIAAYDHALHLDPEHVDAEFNRALVEDLLKQQQSAERSDTSDRSQSDGSQNDENEGSQSSDSAQQQDGARREEESQTINKGTGSAEDTENNASNPGQDADGATTGEARKDAVQQAGNKELDAQKEAQTSEVSTKPGERTQDPPAQQSIVLSTEEQQALEQWLRQIPDDPGGLLKRKFALESQRRGTTTTEQQLW